MQTNQGPTVSDNTPSVAGMTRIVLRPIGSPLPLGFLGLAGATMTLSGLELGWVPAGLHDTVGLVLVAFAVPAQLIASIFGFLSRDTVCGTGMGVLAGTWLTVGLAVHDAPPVGPNRALAVFLFVAAAAMVSPATAAATAKIVPALVMALAAVRFLLTALWLWFGGKGWEHVGGWEGLALCAFALYTAFGLELEDTLRRLVLPLGRFGLGRRVLTGGVGDNLDLVEREAGVREQL